MTHYPKSSHFMNPIPHFPEHYYGRTWCTMEAGAHMSTSKQMCSRLWASHPVMPSLLLWQCGRWKNWSLHNTKHCFGKNEIWRSCRYLPDCQNVKNTTTSHGTDRGEKNLHEFITSQGQIIDFINLLGPRDSPHQSKIQENSVGKPSNCSIFQSLTVVLEVVLDYIIGRTVINYHYLSTLWSTLPAT